MVHSKMDTLFSLFGSKRNKSSLQLNEKLIYQVLTFLYAKFAAKLKGGSR